MDLHLNDKVAVVSGGSRGIGLATVRQLRAEGMQVLAGSRRSTPELEATGAAHLAVDLTTAEGPERLVADALACFGRLDVLVNNVAKAALNALTKLVSEQFGPKGVRAITVSPGPTRTGVWTDAGGMVARAIAFAASPNNITGSELLVDGGIIKHA